MLTNQNQSPRNINFLSQRDNSYYRGKRAFRISRFIIYILIVLIVSFAVFSWQIMFTNDSLSAVFTKRINVFQQLGMMMGGGGPLQGETNDRINVLLLGIGGLGHDGPNLTDTIMLASFKPSTKQLALTSIPRDLLVNAPGYGWRKINELNAIGETVGPGQGPELEKTVLETTLGVPIQYYVLVDFRGFEKIVDELGGLDITVDKSFVDYQYPDNDFGYAPIAFQAGKQKMDGETALKFVRSRHGTNNENSDFSRSARQQKVLAAVRAKLFSYQFLLNPVKISDMAGQISSHLRTNLEPWEIVKLARLFQSINEQNIINRVLDDGPNGFLRASILNGGYYLQPVDNDFTTIQYLVKNIFQGTNAIGNAQSANIRVEIRNGTAVAGLASRYATELKLINYEVIKTGNAQDQTLAKTIVYKITGKEVNDAENLLAKKFNTTVIHDQIPDWIKAEVGPDIDFFIVLGQDSDLPVK